MKKWIGLITLIILAIGLLQVLTNNYSEAEKFATDGDYKTFHSLIEKDINTGNKDAESILTTYFLQSIVDKNIKAIEFLLQKDNTLIDKRGEEDVRAMDALLSNESANVPMLELLLKYKPDLNYKIPSLQNFSFLQVAAGSTQWISNTDIIKLLLEAGANPNFYAQTGKASTSVLLLSYISNNLGNFKVLLNYDAKINHVYENDSEKKNDILFYITGSYIVELKKKGIVIEDFYNKPLAKHIFTALQQEKYQAIHLRNLEYLKEIATHGLIPEANTYGLSKLVHFYAATNEIIGIKLLVDNGACNRSAICDEAYDIAVQNDNRKIMKILKERTSLL